MTRKDYVRLAAALAEWWTCRPTGGTDRERMSWENGFRVATMAVGDGLEKDNPRFDRRRFYRAVAPAIEAWFYGEDD